MLVLAMLVRSCLDVTESDAFISDYSIQDKTKFLLYVSLQKGHSLWWSIPFCLQLTHPNRYSWMTNEFWWGRGDQGELKDAGLVNIELVIT